MVNESKIKANNHNERSLVVNMLIFSVILIFSIILSVTFGSVQIHPIDVFEIIKSNLLGLESILPESMNEIVWGIRLPRVLMGAIVGAGLGVIGVCMQSLVQNPIADPYILGISSGASLGATLYILTGLPMMFSGLGIKGFAFIGSITSTIIVYNISKLGGKPTPVKFILAGTAISAIFSSITNLIVMRSDNKEGIKDVMFWTMGRLSGARWDDLLLITIIVGAGIILLMYQYRNMNVLLMGDESATTLGLKIDYVRKFLMIISSLLTAVIVCVAGSIGFVGIMIPHIVRYLVGSNHKRLLPMTALVGAIFLIWADVLARTIAIPEEIPIGIITSITGAPFFLYLMVKKSGTFGGSK